MADRDTRMTEISERDGGPQNAFSEDFLRRMDLADEPESAREADLAGPWTVRPVPYQGGDGFAALRQWESLERGDLPFAVFRRREMALLAAAVLPGNGRDALFRLQRHLDSTVEPPGFAIAGDPEESRGIFGHVREFDEGFVAALHVAATLVRSPEALARLLEAAGYLALDQAGRILYRNAPGGAR
ncbi:MAG TPA: hypothetical protein VHQ90_13545 [Thermoanaerobaculia bacterium]|nr:hypothetical protein [Thermoanaerobaculia bacterium]